MNDWQPNSTLGAFGLAGFVTAIVGLVAPPQDAYTYAMIFIAVMGGALAAIHLGAWSVRGWLGLSERRAYLREMWDRLLTAPVVPVTAEPEAADDPALAQHWRIARHKFLAAGVRYGFAIRRMVGAGVVTWDNWGIMAADLEQVGVLTKTPRAGWADGWTWARWEAECRTLPCPTDREPPAVAAGPTPNVGNVGNAVNTVE